MGFFKAEGLFLGWVGKQRNNLHFRIIGQGKIKIFYPLKFNNAFYNLYF